MPPDSWLPGIAAYPATKPLWPLVPPPGQLLSSLPLRMNLMPTPPPGPPNEELLVQRLLARDENALRQLHQRYAQSLDRKSVV